MVVSLSDYEASLGKAREVLLKRLKDLQAEDGLIFSAVGARLCYSEEPPTEVVFSDPRVSDPEERSAFLMRLFKSKHYSVFSHSPLVTVLPKEESREVSRLFKVWTFPKNEEEDYVCFNVRHVAEALEFSPGKFESFLQRNLKRASFRFFWIDFETLEMKEATTSRFNERGIAAMVLDASPWQWFSFIAHRLSRIFSHQLVRHTWQNFSQRSHRYTKVDRVVVPKTALKSEGSKIAAQHVVDTSLSWYYELIGHWRVPKEDARFLTPSGAETTIMASGPRFVFEDFVRKRNHPKAQWEIRRFAQAVESVLKAV